MLWWRLGALAEVVRVGFVVDWLPAFWAVVKTALSDMAADVLPFYLGPTLLAIKSSLSAKLGLM